MSTPASPLDETSVVSRLRLAGCVFAEDEARLLLSAATTPADLAAMVERRSAGLPLEQVLGWAQFCDLRIAVEPGIFVPRRRTEFLVRVGARLAREAPGRAGRADGPVVIVDLCCGSGAVGAALAADLTRDLGQVVLHATDVDPVSVRCARGNLAAFGGQVHQGDLYDPLPPELCGRIDILVVNAPYVPTDEVALMPPEARLHEPLVALDGGADGLDIQRRIAAEATSWLAPGGHLLIETSQRQAAGTVTAVANGGLLPRVLRSAELSATVVTGTKRDGSGQDKADDEHASDGLAES
jgi:release factor glutamine methyltransferase